MNIRTAFWSSAIALTLGGALLSSQQQAAEAPASSRPTLTRPAVAGRHGLVTTGHPIASSAGLQILMKGGNAFDAAVAVGAMPRLAEPEMNGIGGNGFMTVFDKKTGKVLSLAMTGAAPKAIKPSEMTAETLNAGVKAGIVPGNLGGYLQALDRFGTMSLAEVFAPAIEAAEQGYPIDPMLAQSIARGPQQPRQVPDHREDLPAERRAAQGRRAVAQSRLRGSSLLAGRGRAAGQGQGRLAQRRPSRRRSIGSTRVTSRRSSIASSRPTAAC